LHAIIIVIVLNHFLNGLKLRSEVVLNSTDLLHELKQIQRRELKQVVPEAREVLIRCGDMSVVINTTILQNVVKHLNLVLGVTMAVQDCERGEDLVIDLLFSLV